MTAKHSPRICGICRRRLAEFWDVYSFPTNRNLCRGCLLSSADPVTFLRCGANPWYQVRAASWRAENN